MYRVTRSLKKGRKLRNLKITFAYPYLMLFIILVFQSRTEFDSDLLTNLFYDPGWQPKMNMIISSFGKVLKSIISLVIRLAYYVVSLKKSKSQSGLYQRQKFSALNGHESVQRWTESLPLSFGVSSKTIKVVTEPREMYNMMMVGLAVAMRPV